MINPLTDAQIGHFVREHLFNKLPEIARIQPEDGNLRWESVRQEHELSGTTANLGRASLQLCVVVQALERLGMAHEDVQPMFLLMEALQDVREGKSPPMLKPGRNPGSKPFQHFQRLKDLCVMLVEAHREKGVKLPDALNAVAAALKKHRILGVRKGRTSGYEISANTLEDWREELIRNDDLESKVQPFRKRQELWTEPSQLIEHVLKVWISEDQERDRP